jgi:hypothetical protein
MDGPDGRFGPRAARLRGLAGETSIACPPGSRETVLLPRLDQVPGNDG